MLQKGKREAEAASGGRLACVTESLRGKTDLISHPLPVCMNRHPLCWKKRPAPSAHSSAASTARASRWRQRQNAPGHCLGHGSSARASPSAPQDKKQPRKESSVVQEAPTSWWELVLYFQHHPLAHVLQQADDLVMPQLGQVNAIHRLDVIPHVQLVTPAKK